MNYTEHIAAPVRDNCGQDCERCGAKLLTASACDRAGAFEPGASVYTSHDTSNRVVLARPPINVTINHCAPKLPSVNDSKLNVY